jgi:tetratricopeptide (TPR) repeat protein/predicted Ser/Thr protein kinase
MKGDRWQRIETVLDGALQLPPAARAEFVRANCDGDAALEAEVLALIAEASNPSSFLQEPLVGTRGPGDDLRRATPAGGMTADGVRSYRIVRELGAGGMGVVYLAMQEGVDFERPVALKVIRRGLATDDVLRRFRLERRILAALRHPAIAGLIDAGETVDARPFFAMEFVEGVPIDQYCERERLSVPARIKLIQDVCEAVQHAHANLVLHRDLKPSNVLVRANGTVVLLDFGIGKLLEPGVADTTGGANSAEATLTMHRAFTPGSAAPEQIRGEQATTATDVFGLGLLLYRVLAGKPAFDEKSGAEFANAADAPGPVPPSAHGNRELAGDLDTIVLKAIRREPDRRYASALALADDLQRYLDGRPVRARADTFAYRATKFAKRNRLPIVAATLVFGALVFATFSARARSAAVARERDKALEVRGFLLEMFGSSGAGGADSVSVRQLLDGQTAQVSLLYRDSPEMRAEMLAVLAEGYDRLGIFAPAESLATEALTIRRQSLPETHPDVAASLNLLGWIKFERGRRDEGETLLRDAAKRWPQASPANPAAHARTLNDLGVAREAAGDYAEATELYRRALAMRRAAFGETHRAVAITESNLSVVLFRKGELPAAIAAAESALAVMRRAAGPEHQRSTLIQGNLAAMRAQNGDAAGAEAEYRDLLARQIRVSGASHPVTAGSMIGLASTLRARGRFEAADSFATAGLAALEAAYGPLHPRVANAAAMVGSVRAARGQHGEAREMFERALRAHRASPRTTPATIAPIQLRLVRSLVALGRRSSADSVLRSVPDSAWSKSDRLAADSLRETVKRP